MIMEKINKYLVYIFGFLTVTVIILQITMSKAGLSQLETTLFSILQFIFSLFFAWMLSKMSLQDQFQQSQKKFALAAYRRIKEIERSNDRLVQLTDYKIAQSKEVRELEIINLLAVNVRGTIRASVADWADIIGEELEVLGKLEQKETEYEILLSNKTFEKLSIDLTKEIKDAKEEIDKLKNNLPLSLKIQQDNNEEDKESSNKITLAINLMQLKRLTDNEGFLQLEGFWDEGFDVDIGNYTIGNQMMVRLGDIAGREDVLVVFDNEGRKVGVLTNILLPFSYNTFSSSVFEFLERSEFEVTISHIDEKIDPSTERREFKVKVKVKNNILTGD
ncbi:hypothetical protein LPY66_15275 [Dehalobacter sp. DCM]|uniref:hypothetical protein n=1 Tax=Dehalobacter sp. DCM TaxID=2907827 RepID=UPI003081A4F3|nr:hypothetical protein LPY66_15275 [Dehalobacter sp. DCM]